MHFMWIISCSRKLCDTHLCGPQWKLWIITTGPLRVKDELLHVFLCLRVVVVCRMTCSVLSVIVDCLYNDTFIQLHMVLKACLHLNQIESILISHLDRGVPSIHLDRVRTTELVCSDREWGTSLTCNKLHLFKTVGRAEHVGMVVALVDPTYLCWSRADCVASERSAFQKL